MSLDSCGPAGETGAGAAGGAAAGNAPGTGPGNGPQKAEKQPSPGAPGATAAADKEATKNP